MTFQKIVEKFQSYQEVVAIGLGGSCANETSDNLSDIDMYVFVEREIPLCKREFIKEFSSKFEIGGEYFGSGDEFFVDDMNR